MQEALLDIAKVDDRVARAHPAVEDVPSRSSRVVLSSWSMTITVRWGCRIAHAPEMSRRATANTPIAVRMTDGTASAA
jgi:hypothetical protein